MTAKRYSFAAHPEHKDRLGEYAAKWIDIAMRTRPMDDEDRRICLEEVPRLYAAAGLPPPKHIVFTTSPMVMRYAGSYAAAIWGRRKGPSVPASVPLSALASTAAATLASAAASAWDSTSASTRAATEASTAASTRASTEASTRAATWASTWDSTSASTWASTWDSTEAATAASAAASTRDSTLDATWASTEAATLASARDSTLDATWASTEAATLASALDSTLDATWDSTWDSAERGGRTVSLDRWYVGDEGCIAANPPGTFGLECARDAYRMWQGGNQWAGWCSYLNFFREVAQLPIDWSKWMPWERLAEHGGPRIVHSDFCIISDFPVVLTKDAENRPHNDTGPFCRWSDGVALYAVHGTRVPAWLIECPERLTREAIDAETNDEVRRVMIDRYGVGRYTSESGREIERCQDWDQGLDVVMYERPGIPGEVDRVVRVLRMENSTPDPDGTRRTYWRRVPPSMGCREAYLWTCGLPAGAQFVVRS